VEGDAAAREPGSHTSIFSAAYPVKNRVTYTSRDYIVSIMSKISVEIPDELLADLDEHVGDDKKFVNRSDAVRASIRKTLDLLDEIDNRHDRLDDE
jgi:hypothetical protein